MLLDIRDKVDVYTQNFADMAEPRDCWERFFLPKSTLI